MRISCGRGYTGVMLQSGRTQAVVIRRIREHVSAHNWFAVTVDIAIVVIGVFLGTQVSNWNVQRLEKRETQRMLAQLKPNLQLLSDFYPRARAYYGTTRRYAATAISGWNGERQVSDEQFVIAAYQASQIFGIGTNGSTWATVLGADQLRNIDDLAIRNELSFLMSADYTQIDLSAVNTPYRQNVRRLIPADLQDAIRAQCGDKAAPGASGWLYLPATCDLKVAPQEAARAAKILRANPQLVNDLQWHLAAQAAFLSNLNAFELATQRLQRLTSQLRE